MQVASDVVRDGLGVELLAGDSEVVAEVFRCDADHSLILATFRGDVPLSALEDLIAYAREKLEPFEDGTPLPRLTQQKPNQTPEPTRQS